MEGKREMRKNIMRVTVLLAFVAFTIGCDTAPAKQESSEKKAEGITTEQLAEGVVVEAACGECMFGLEGSSCDLAVRFNGKAYFVDGSTIDDHGDAHAEDGFCSAVRQAKVKGHLENDRFMVASFELIAEEEHHHHSDEDGHVHN